MDTNTITQEIAQRVSKALDDSDVTVAGLSRIIGTPRTTLIRQLSGHKEFTISNLVTIGKEVGLDYTDFIPAELLGVTE